MSSPSPAPTPPQPSGGAPMFPADWSQFFPDVISSIWTGILVGVALYLVDRWRTARRERGDMRTDWDRLQPRIRTYFRRPLGEQWSTGFSFQGTAELLTILQEAPINDWQKELKTPELAALVRLERNLSVAPDVAREYQSALTERVSTAAGTAPQQLVFPNGLNLTDQEAWDERNREINRYGETIRLAVTRANVLTLGADTTPIDQTIDQADGTDRSAEEVRQISISAASSPALETERAAWLTSVRDRERDYNTIRNHFLAQDQPTTA